MRAALIVLEPPGDGGAPAVAGRFVCVRQAEFALRCGCELVLAQGHGASPEALAVRHLVEAAGARFQMMATSHALPAAVGPGDSLLVLQPGLLAEAEAAVALLADGPVVLVLPPGAAAPAGFERIDLTRTWGGVMLVPGTLLESLNDLPADCALAPALLRLALQNHIPERRLPDGLLHSRQWLVIADAAQAREHEPDLLRLHLGETPASAPSRLLARRVLLARGGAWLGQPRVQAVLLALMVTLACAALVAAWFGEAVAAFALLVPAAPMAACVIGLKQLEAAPFGSAGRWYRLRYGLDLALVACAMLVLDGPWHRQLFAPLVIAAALLLLDRHPVPRLAEPLRDRGVLAALAALALAILPAEPALALVALVLLAASLLRAPRERG